MPRVIKVTFMDGNEWKLPFNIALGLHIALILGTIYMPDILKKKPLFPEIYTIDLVNVQLSPPPPEIIKSPAAQPPKKAVSVAPPEPVEKIKPVKPISIKPKRKKKIVKTKRVDESQKKKLEQIHKQRLQEAREAERRAQEAAEIAAAQAVEQLKNMLRESSVQTKKTDNRGTTQPQRPPQRGSANIVEKQYFASIFNSLQPHWKLPETKIWDPELVATIVIRISQSGEVTKYYFEQKSGDRLFDQFVLKAIQDGTPLPPIPKAMQKTSLEVGLHFKPGSIQY